MGTAPSTHVVGSFVSPYVRKVLVALDIKGVDYDIDPIVPFYGNERFSQWSPLRRVPVLRDDAVTLADSSVICQYLEDRYPEPRLYPADVAARAEARWLEEFADSRMGDVIIWRLFNQIAIGPAVWGRPADPALVRKTIDEDIPSVLDYLEGIAPADGFLHGSPSIANISIATFFRNAAFARFSIDAARWPRTAAFVARTLALPSFAKLVPFEEACLRVPVTAHRQALAKIGAPLSAETVGLDRPIPGIMPIS